MYRLKNFLWDAWARMRGRPRRQLVVLHPPHATRHFYENAQQARPRPENPALRALGQIFAPHHAAEEEVLYRPVGRDGVVLQQTEEWFREGDSMRTRMRKTMVVTCSGAIVTPEKLRGVCQCGGYDDVIARCAVCGCALCRLHVRTFPQPTGDLTLCEAHYRQAVNAFNTWSAMDQARPKVIQR